MLGNDEKSGGNVRLKK